MTAPEYAELRCPLPVIVLAPSDDANDTPTDQPCGEQLFVNHTDSRYLLAGGECEGAPPRWEVVCGNGHVLLVPDCGGNDWAVPFDLATVQRCLLDIGVSADGGGPIDLQPLPGAAP